MPRLLRTGYLVKRLSLPRTRAGELQRRTSPQRGRFRDRLHTNVGYRLKPAKEPARVRRQGKTHERHRIIGLGVERGVMKQKAAKIAECDNSIALLYLYIGQSV